MEVADIIEAIDIAEYISQFVDLEEKGGELWGLSPFKDENTPSFSLNPEKGFWYDFSAGVGGNLIDFVMRHENVSVKGAVNILRKYANISEQDGTTVHRLEATRIARQYRNRVKPRAITTAKPLPPNYMDRYEFRKDKLKIWADEGISWDIMRKYSIRYDAFDNRIVYPIRDYDGNIISVCGRTCDPDFKAKKIRKYTYFQEIGTVDTLYGFSDNKDAIMQSKEIILFEGAKSCLKMAGWGYMNTSAILTSHLSPNQYQFLLKLSSWHGVRIVFALDSDVDITKDKNIMKLAQYARVEWVKNIGNLLPDKDSPTDQGLEIFKNLYNERRRLL